jgi:hypothetical protein
MENLNGCGVSPFSVRTGDSNPSIQTWLERKEIELELTTKSISGRDWTDVGMIVHR